MSIRDEVKKQDSVNNENKYNNEIDYLETSKIINKLNDLETITSSSINEISKSLDNFSKKLLDIENEFSVIEKTSTNLDEINKIFNGINISTITELKIHLVILYQI